MNEDRKMSEELSWLRRKIEAISAQLQSIKNIEEPNSAGNLNKNIHLDVSKYVDALAFNEFQKNVRKELDFLSLRCDEFKRMFDEVFASLKTKITEKELKTLEGLYLIII